MAGISLSDLPDDLLRRVLFFVPAREGAATAVLSRRWRSLWLSSGAVNLHWHSDRSGYTWKERQNFFCVPEAALAAAHAHGPVRRLTFHASINFYMSRHGEKTIGALLSNPAARLIEDLQFTVYKSGDTCGPDQSGGGYKINLGTLPSEALRVLHITKCNDMLPAPPGAAFLQLAVLRLRACTVFLCRLQRVIDAAPQLATLHLERSCLVGVVEEVSGGTHGGAPSWVERFQLRCPAVTSLLLANCRWPGWVQGGMELDLPRLQYFRYVGFVERLSLKSHALNIARVDLHFIDEVYPGEDKMRDKMRVSFWKFVQTFKNTKILMVKLNYLIEHIAVAKEDQNELLRGKFFSNLERLELEALHMPSSKATAVAMANLLYCCPVVRDLRLKLTRTITIPVIPFGGDDADDCEVSYIPSLSECSFDCLQSCLRRVRLQIGLEYLNCFGVQLARFLAENALVLEEMYIEDGNNDVCQDVNRLVKRRNSPCIAGFALLPYEL